MKYLSLIFLLFLSTDISAQKSKKWDKAITSIEKSEFIEKFMKNKTEIETQVSDFWNYKSVIRDEDYKSIGIEYEIVRNQLDAILNNIKMDFTDWQSRKIFASSPDKILMGYNYELDEVMNYYNNNCLRFMNEIIGSTIGADPWTLIITIIDVGRFIIDGISDKIKQTKKMSAEYFENQCLYKYRLRTWDSY